MSYRCKCCGSPATKCCSRCKKVYYCSEVCQKRDWPMHRLECGKYVKDYTDSKNKPNSQFLPDYSFEQDNEEVTIQIPIPSDCQKEDVKVIITNCSLTITIKQYNYNEHFDLYDLINPYESSWTWSDAVLLIQLKKKNQTTWKYLTKETVINTPSTETLVQRPFLIQFQPTTNRVHILIQSSNQLDPSSIYVQKLNTPNQTISHPQTRFSLHWCETPCYYYELIIVCADIDTASASCYLENQYIVIDMNVIRFDETVATLSDSLEFLLYRECSSIQPFLSSLLCTRCSTLISSSLKTIKRAPSPMWSDLCEEMYCDHGGNVHDHPEINTSGIMHTIGTAFIRSPSILVCSEDCINIETTTKNDLLCTHCHNCLGTMLITDNNEFTCEFYKDRIKFNKEEHKGFYSSLRRCLLSLLDIYRAKSVTHFYCYAKMKHVTVILTCPIVFLQLYEEDTTQVKQAIQIEITTDERQDIDIPVQFQLMDIVSILSAVKKASISDTELITINQKDYYYVI